MLTVNKQPVLTTELGRLLTGDCLELMGELEAESIDTFFADPPFNLSKDYGPHVDDNLPEGEYLAWCFRWIDEAVRVLKPGGSFFLYNLPKWNVLLASYVSRRLNFRNWITIELTFSLPIQGRLYPSNYSLLYFVKGKKPNTFNPPRVPMQVCRHCGGEIKDYGGYKGKMNPKGISLSDVWTDIPPVRHQKYKTREANALSLKLMDRILDISTVESDVVLDPFGGSGTTYVAAELKGRRWIGMEISTTSAIVDRFAHLELDRAHLIEIEKRKNTLFTPEALSLRKKSGLTNDKYRLETTAHQHGLFLSATQDSE